MGPDGGSEVDIAGTERTGGPGAVGDAGTWDVMVSGKVRGIGPMVNTDWGPCEIGMSLYIFLSCAASTGWELN